MNQNHSTYKLVVEYQGDGTANQCKCQCVNKTRIIIQLRNRTLWYNRESCDDNSPGLALRIIPLNLFFFFFAFLDALLLVTTSGTRTPLRTCNTVLNTWLPYVSLSNLSQCLRSTRQNFTNTSIVASSVMWDVLLLHSVSMT